MKKVIFVTPHMILGGVEKALLNMLKAFYKDFEITVLFVNKEGAMLRQIPPEIQTETVPGLTHLQSKLLTGGGVKRLFFYFMKRFRFVQAFKLIYRKAIKHDIFADCIVPFSKLPMLREKYDFAICFHMHMPFIVRYVIEKISADKKYIWAHNDFTTSGFQVKKLENYLQCYDKIFTVSLQLRSELLQIFPQYEHKIVVQHNLIDRDDIIEKSKERQENPFCNYDGLKILTIGRLDPQKGYDLAIAAAANLKREGIAFKWLAVGDGQKGVLKKLIAKYGLCDDFILYGSTLNPYPLLSQCDIYCQPSRHEGMVTTVNEAKVLNKPIVATNFTAINEQIKHGENGLICEKDGNSIAQAVITMEKLRLNSNDGSYDAHEETNKLKRYFESQVNHCN